MPNKERSPGTFWLVVGLSCAVAGAWYVNQGGEATKEPAGTAAEPPRATTAAAAFGDLAKGAVGNAVRLLELAHREAAPGAPRLGFHAI